MLTENDVVEATCARLTDCGFTVVNRNSTNDRGIDIVATRDGWTVLVEAKGQTTSKRSRRQGKEFNRNQTRTHVSVALFTAARLLQESMPNVQRRRVAIALPDNKHHRDMVQGITQSLRTLDISVIWVGLDGKITCTDSWLNPPTA